MNRDPRVEGGVSFLPSPEVGRRPASGLQTEENPW